MCKESREIALKPYRLAFDSPNVHFDLRTYCSSGPGIFPTWATPSGTIQLVEPKGGGRDYVYMELRPAVVADLHKVMRLGFKYVHGWPEYDDEVTGEHSHGGFRPAQERSSCDSRV